MLRLLIVVASLFFMTSCISYNASTQKDLNSYIQLSGDFYGSELIIDKNPSIVVDKNVRLFTLDGKKVAKFAIPKGTHTVVVVKDGREVVSRKVFVSEGNVVEMMVP